MRNCPSDLELTMLAEGTLSGSEAARIRHHAATCPHCSNILVTIQEMSALDEANLLSDVKNSDYKKACKLFSSNGLHQKKKEFCQRADRFRQWLDKTGRAVSGFIESSEPCPALADNDDSDLCAIRCEAQVLKEFGQEIPLVQLIEESRSRGWYRPGHGTALKHLGNLLELHGLQVSRIHGASAEDLRREIAAGHRVIAAVDRGELEAETLAERIAEGVEELFVQKPDHAVCVFEVVEDPNGTAVRLSDSSSEAFSAPVPWTVFEAAWDDSNRLLVSAWGKRIAGEKI